MEPKELNSPYLHSILIAHRGKLVIEEYFHGYHRNTPHDTRSASKTLTSVLFGAALEQGVFNSVDDLVYPLFNGVDAYDNADPRKNEMTIRHLLSMASGFDCDDGISESLGNENRLLAQDKTTDLHDYMLSLPMVSAPGEVEPGYANSYCTGGINLVGGVIKQATGISLPQFFQEALAEPLGIFILPMRKNACPSRCI